MEMYNAEFQNLIDRDCIEAVALQEIKEWEANGGLKTFGHRHQPIQKCSKQIYLY